jgi:two-component system response regulator HydG
VDLLQRQIQPSASLDALVGVSRAIAKAKDLIQRAAAAPGTVLITGETGTGKELAARAIHVGSARKAGAFVPVNCAALTESLLEAELFGHAKGAFTGAAGPRAGLIEHAEGGTLFLDEIGTLSKGLQAKLLRTLEAGEVRRLGENESRHVDVRFVTATNIDLKEAAAAGEFRSDLYYRVHVHHVHMPPLRERAEDIPLLVEHFLARYGRGAAVLSCAPAAMDALKAFSFPGNVRQLEHIVQRAVATARSAEITLDDLPEELLAEPAGPAPPEGSVARARENAEREMIVATLARNQGEIGAAARELQVSRTTMWRLMKKHGIEAP